MRESRDAIRAAFDSRAAGYARSDWHVRYAQRLVRLAAVRPGTRVLDAATGTGFAALAAAAGVGSSGRVVAVDISAGMLDQARRAVAAAGVANIELVRADAADLAGFPDASFDLVLCSAGLLYLPVHAALREWHRLLVDGGRVGFSTMREGFPVAGRLFRRHAADFGLELADPAAALGDVDRCRGVLGAAGFVVDHVTAESIRFARADLDGAWEAHVRGAHYAAVNGLDPARVREFRSAYTADLLALLERDEELVCRAEVIYAFGRKVGSQRGTARPLSG